MQPAALPSMPSRPGCRRADNPHAAPTHPPGSTPMPTVTPPIAAAGGPHFRFHRRWWGTEARDNGCCRVEGNGRAWGLHPPVGEGCVEQLEEAGGVRGAPHVAGAVPQRHAATKSVGLLVSSWARRARCGGVGDSERRCRAVHAIHAQRRRLLPFPHYLPPPLDTRSHPPPPPLPPTPPPPTHPPTTTSPP